MSIRFIAASILLAAALPATGLQARTKLVTLPDRARVVMSLEHPHRTLLYEEREIPLQKGNNDIDFSWTGVSIDPNSVMLEFLSHPGDGPDATRIISTSFPPNENALTWMIYTPTARTERIRVSYLLNGISQENSYEMSVNQAETQGNFRHYLLLRNGSGETLQDAVIRLGRMENLTRSVDAGEARRFLAARVPELKVQKLYVMRPQFDRFLADEPEQVSLVYQIENKQEAGLGRNKLPAGKVRLYGDDGMNSSIFLGEDMLSQTPPGEKAEITLGTVRDVVVKRRLLRNERTNERRNNNRNVVLFDQVRELQFEIENFKNDPVTLKVHEPMVGDWEITSSLPVGVRTERKSSGELILYIDLEAAPKGEPAVKKLVAVNVLIKNRFPSEM